jgi:hypothetical protein
MAGVSIEKQAEYSVLLDDKVRELVRRHIKEALEDPSFMGGLNGYYISEATMRNLNPSNHLFQQAIKNVIVQQMNKY